MKRVLTRGSAVAAAAFLSSLLLLTSCASENAHIVLYAGPELPDTEIAQLFIAESLEVDSINGEDIPGILRVMRSGERRLDLLPGHYEVAARYDTIWPVNANEDIVVGSEPRLVNLDLEVGHRYRLDHIHPIDLVDAQRLARNLKLTVVDLSGGKPIDLAVESRPAAPPPALVINPSSRPAVAAAPATLEKRTIVPPHKVDEMNSAAPEDTDARTPFSALQLLRFGWQQASAEERERFLDWVEE